VPSQIPQHKRLGPIMKRNHHKTETRKREIVESYCAEKGCKFFGQPAAQGICHDVIHPLQKKYLDTVMRYGQDRLRGEKSLRKANKLMTDRKWIQHLEGELACEWANAWFTLDELVYLRAENAKLRLALGKWGKHKR
jgi:hypothetical protein